MQPHRDERSQAEGDRGDQTGNDAVEPPAEQKRERQRDQDLHGRLGTDRRGQRKREGLQPQWRQRRALTIRQQRMPAARQRVP